ncbi:hypothetical protein AM493_15895 [Flavobacterium akiainvivens]|uniref:DUF3575 domain-containing protein n=1 Tax=Flavobacterium akiainvivens TaxID=1202724 RepID=A0A0M8MJY3_9FLAO|nr:hypothetical protein [Flavobacterium akiainvivens]KOS07357.1 hypothetical protein AM493_15895 [Flavobacterium akiainvivens]
MKKPIMLLLLLTGAVTATYAQVDSTGINSKKHEIKIGAIKGLAGGIIEGTYEYINSPYFTYGASILGNLDTNNDYPEDFSITPFARFYFTESREYGAKGFFVEGFGKFIAGREYTYTTEVYYDQNGNEYWNGYDRDEKYTAGSIGLAIGWKWVNHAGFVFEILAGGGRNFGQGTGPDASFRGDFNIGYRF